MCKCSQADKIMDFNFARADSVTSEVCLHSGLRVKSLFSLFFPLFIPESFQPWKDQLALHIESSAEMDGYEDPGGC